jgi:hypothetical protein
MKRLSGRLQTAIGIHKRIGGHTFLHSFGTLLKANGDGVKTVSGGNSKPL